MAHFLGDQKEEILIILAKNGQKIEPNGNVKILLYVTINVRAQYCNFEAAILKLAMDSFSMKRPTLDLAISVIKTRSSMI